MLLLLRLLPDILFDAEHSANFEELKQMGFGGNLFYVADTPFKNTDWHRTISQHSRSFCEANR